MTPPIARRAFTAAGVRASVAAIALFVAPLIASCAPTPAPSARVPFIPQRQRVLLVSIDGFRADYLDRPLAVNLQRLAARGVHATRMIPSFPSKTFPNHYTIVTGLTPEHHGIVANNMRDPALGDFRLSLRNAVTDARWWGGEPIWVTAEKQGVRTASVFWPGSEAAIGGVRPWRYERYEEERPAAARVRQVLEWLAMPPDQAPRLVSLYFSELDVAGHEHGPDAPETHESIARVDAAIGQLVDGIARLGLTDVVNIIVVSDHGMSQLSPDRLIFLDDYIDMATIDLIDGSPVAAIAPRGDVEAAYRALAGKHPHLQVYRKGEVPARLRFNAHPRITPLVAIADDGWTITVRDVLARQGRGAFRGGAHGYDPDLRSMGALFVAAGPGIAVGRELRPFRNVHVYSVLAELLGVRPVTTDGSLDSVRRILR